MSYSEHREKKTPTETIIQSVAAARTVNIMTIILLLNSVRIALCCNTARVSMGDLTF